MFYSGYCLATLFYGSACLCLFALPRARAQALMVTWNAVVLFWLQFCCGVRYQVVGERALLDAPCVVVANHQSPWETFFLQKHFFPLTTVLKKQLLSIPFFGWGMRIMNPIAIDRSTPMQALKQIKQMGIARLQAGHRLLIFPEGTRVPVGQLAPFKRSAADIAKQAAVPLVPVAHDAGRYWLNKRFIKKPGVIKLTIGKPIDTEGKNTKELMEEIQQWIDQQVYS